MPSAQIRADAAERRSQALQLRLTGASFEAIGQELGGISPQRAHQIYKEALKQVVREPNDDRILVEVERLDMLFRAMVVRALNGSARHAEVALHIAESRRRLLGLDAPSKVDMKVYTIDQLDDRIAELTQLLAANDDRPQPVGD